MYNLQPLQAPINGYLAKYILNFFLQMPGILAPGFFLKLNINKITRRVSTCNYNINKTGIMSIIYFI